MFSFAGVIAQPVLIGVAVGMSLRLSLSILLHIACLTAKGEGCCSRIAGLEIATKIRVFSFGLAGGLGPGPCRDQGSGASPIRDFGVSDCVRPSAASWLLAPRIAVAGVAAPARARGSVVRRERGQSLDDSLLQLSSNLDFLRVGVALCVVVYRCCKGCSDSIPKLGNLLSLSDVAWNGIRDSRFGCAPTGVLAARGGAW